MAGTTLSQRLPGRPRGSQFKVREGNNQGRAVDFVARARLSSVNHGGRAMSVNKALLIGNLGKDPEVRFTASGRAVARFAVATSEVWNGAERQRRERHEWHHVVAWGKPAETCGQVLA